MGLDMTLSREIYIGAFYAHNDIEITMVIKKEGNPISINPYKIETITEQLLSWRKANAIHNWFVQHVQDGEDDCKDYEVTIDDIKQLLKTCKTIKDNPESAKDLLPTTSGFFFGDTDYNEYYFQEIDKTIIALKNIVKNHCSNYSYRYSSSW